MKRDPSGSGAHPPGLSAAIERARRDKRWRVGRYVLLEELGQGGHGVVYQAWDPQSERLVAVKLLLNLADKARGRFEREIRATARLQHPNLVPLYDSGVDDGRLYLVMRYVSGRSLQEVCARTPPTPLQAARLVRDLARAIHYAHGEGVLHRDLKPANVLLDEQGRGLITDFGLARFEDSDSDLTRTGSALGTPAYMAPEQADHRRGNVDARADVYGLGATLYHCLTGGPPFDAGSQQELMVKLIGEAPQPPSQRTQGEVPPDLDTICLHCLAKEPAARYADARALAEDLERLLDGEPIRARPASRLRRLGFWLRRNRGVAATAALGLLATLLVAGWTLWLGPLWSARAAEARAAALEAAARAALEEELARLAQASPEVVLSEAPAEALRRRVLASVAPEPGAETSRVLALLDDYRAGPLLSRAHLERQAWALAYRHDPLGPSGARAQLEIARQLRRELRLGEAAQALTRVWSREHLPEALELLAEVRMLQADWEQAGRCFEELGRADGEQVALLRALGQVRQRFPVPVYDRPPTPFWQLGSRDRGREPVRVLPLERPTLVLPWRVGHPAWEFGPEGFQPVPSPLGGAPSDQLHDARAVDFDGDGAYEILVTLRRPGVGSGFHVMGRGPGGWEKLSARLDQSTELAGVTAGDFDGDGDEEAVILFDYRNPVHWFVHSPQQVSTFEVRAAQPYPRSPVAVDVDGDGRDELLMLEDPHQGGRAVLYRFEGAQPRVLGQALVGEGGPSAVLPGGRVAALTDTVAGYVEAGEGHPAAQEDCLALFEWRDERLGVVTRETSRGDAATCWARAALSGRLAGQPALAFALHHYAPREGQVGALGATLSVVLGDPTGEPVVLGLPEDTRGLALADLDGDGADELVHVGSERCFVRGPRTKPWPELRGADRELAGGDESQAMLEAALDLLELGAVAEGEALLDELSARHPETPAAREAPRVSTEAALRRAQHARAESLRLMRLTRHEEAEALWQQALRAFADARERARAEARRAPARSELRRRFHEQAAHASRALREWGELARDLKLARESAPRADEHHVGRVAAMTRLAQRQVLDIPAGTAGLPWVADLPCRVWRTPDEGLAIAIDGVTRGHVVGLPLRYAGGALELEIDFALVSSCWATDVTLGLHPREPVTERVGYERPATIGLYPTSTAPWKQQGLSFRIAGLSHRAPTYRGRYQAFIGYYPEVRRQLIEVRQLETGRVVARHWGELERALAPGRHLLGLTGHTFGKDAYLIFPGHPPTTTLILERVALRAAGECTPDRTAPASPRDMELEASRWFMQGDLVRAQNHWARLLQQDSGRMLARVHLALVEPAHDVLGRCFELDPYGALLAIDDALRGAPPGWRLRMGQALRRTQAAHPGWAGVLLGDYALAGPHLEGQQAAHRYARLRAGLRVLGEDDRAWFDQTGLRPPPSALAQIHWAPREGQSGEQALAELRAAVAKLQDGSGDALDVWLAAQRVLLLQPRHADALRWQIQSAGYLSRFLQGLEPCYRLIELEPDDPDGYLLLALMQTQRGASEEAFDALERARERRLDPQQLRNPAFDSLRDHPRFQALLPR